MSIDDSRAPDAMAEFPKITSEMIAAAIMNGRRMRAEATRDMFIWLWRRPTAVAHRMRSARPEAAPKPTIPGARNALSALRASAELLRDNPEIEPEQRRRLVDIVLTEEARLEPMVG